MNNRVLTISFLAFALPLAVIFVLRYEDVQQMVEVDPHEAPGRVLYFTSPT